jgi:predicted dehydrogenase
MNHQGANMNYNRRSFLRSLATTAAGVAVAPVVASPRALGNHRLRPPSDRVRLGFIGVGNRGKQNLDAFLAMGNRVDVVALADVDSSHLKDSHAKVQSQGWENCIAYGDYRKLLENKDIDAVVVSTPDHWHALQTIHACQAGKDVYCEKPLSLTIAEGQAMVSAARSNRRIVQTGSQQRSDDKFRVACEMVRSDRIGKVHTIRVGISQVNFGTRVPILNRRNPPPELDYDFWLGPAPYRPYDPKRVHYNFRFFWDYSGGQLTNMGAHHLDIAQWGLGTDEGGPISAEGKSRYDAENRFEVPEWFEVLYKYANGTTIICGQDQPDGTTFEGATGTIYVNREKLESMPSRVVLEPLAASDVHLNKSQNHYGNWLDCIRSRELPICDVAIGHRSASVCHLGNIAVRSQKTVDWDPIKEVIIGDDGLAQMTQRPYRAPWSLLRGT